MDFEFRIINKFYGPYGQKIINVKLLVMKQNHFFTGMGSYNTCTIKDGVMYPNGGDWICPIFEDILGMLRDPTEGETRLALRARHRQYVSNSPYKKWGDRIAEARFKAQISENKTRYDILVYNYSDREWQKISEIGAS